MYKTVFPVAFGLAIGLYMWYFLKKGSSVKSIKTGTRNTKQEDQEKADSSIKKSAQEPDNLQDKFDPADGNRHSATVTKPNRQAAHCNENTTLLYDRIDSGNLREHDVEEDFGPCNNQDTVSNQPHSEKHDGLLLYAKEDKPLVMDLRQKLVSNLGEYIDNLNIVLYDEFAPEVQSYFKTTGQVFHRCRFLFVVVTSNFREDDLMRYQHEIAFMDSIRNPASKERVIPIWAEEGSQTILPELSVLRGIEYERNQVNIQKFKTTFEYGRRKIHL